MANQAFLESQNRATERFDRDHRPGLLVTLGSAATRQSHSQLQSPVTTSSPRNRIRDLEPKQRQATDSRTTNKRQRSDSPEHRNVSFEFRKASHDGPVTTRSRARAVTETQPSEPSPGKPPANSSSSGSISSSTAATTSTQPEKSALTTSRVASPVSEHNGAFVASPTDITPPKPPTPVPSLDKQRESSKIAWHQHVKAWTILQDWQQSLYRSQIELDNLKQSIARSGGIGAGYASQHHLLTARAKTLEDKVSNAGIQIAQAEKDAQRSFLAYLEPHIQSAGVRPSNDVARTEQKANSPEQQHPRTQIAAASLPDFSKFEARLAELEAARKLDAEILKERDAKLEEQSAKLTQAQALITLQETRLRMYAEQVSKTSTAQTELGTRLESLEKKHTTAREEIDKAQGKLDTKLEGLEESHGEEMAKLSAAQDQTGKKLESLERNHLDVEAQSLSTHDHMRKRLASLEESLTKVQQKTGKTLTAQNRPTTKPESLDKNQAVAQFQPAPRTDLPSASVIIVQDLQNTLKTHSKKFKDIELDIRELKRAPPKEARDNLNARIKTIKEEHENDKTVINAKLDTNVAKINETLDDLKAQVSGFKKQETWRIVFKAIIDEMCAGITTKLEADVTKINEQLDKFEAQMTGFTDQETWLREFKDSIGKANKELAAIKTKLEPLPSLIDREDAQRARQEKLDQDVGGLCTDVKSLKDTASRVEEGQARLDIAYADTKVELTKMSSSIKGAKQSVSDAAGEAISLALRVDKLTTRVVENKEDAEAAISAVKLTLSKHGEAYIEEQVKAEVERQIDALPPPSAQPVSQALVGTPTSLAPAPTSSTPPSTTAELADQVTAVVNIRVLSKVKGMVINNLKSLKNAIHEQAAAGKDREARIAALEAFDIAAMSASVTSLKTTVELCQTAITSGNKHTQDLDVTQQNMKIQITAMDGIVNHVHKQPLHPAAVRTEIEALKHATHALQQHHGSLTNQLCHLSHWQNTFSTKEIYKEVVAAVQEVVPQTVASRMNNVEGRLLSIENAFGAARSRPQSQSSAGVPGQRRQSMPQQQQQQQQPYPARLGQSLSSPHIQQPQTQTSSPAQQYHHHQHFSPMQSQAPFAQQQQQQQQNHQQNQQSVHHNVQLPPIQTVRPVPGGLPTPQDQPQQISPTHQQPQQQQQQHLVNGQSEQR